MKYPASEKFEIIRLVEQLHLPAKQTLDQLGIARRTGCRWYNRFLEGGPEALEDRPSAPSRVWNRIGPGIQDQIVEMALEQTELSPREFAVRALFRIRGNRLTAFEGPRHDPCARRTDAPADAARQCAARI